MAFKAKKHPEKRDDSAASEVAHRFKMHPFLFVGTVIVLVIVIIAFVFVPAIGPSTQGSADLTFGYYNRVPIKYVMNNYFYNVQQFYAQQLQPAQDDPNYLTAVIQIWQRAFEEAAVYTGALDEMKHSGFIVSEEKVDRAMAARPEFQEAGKFSATKYRAMDNAARMNLWRQVRDEIIVSTFMTDFLDLKTSSHEAEFISSMASPRRTFDAAIFPLGAYPESEIRAYAEANPDLFRMIRLSQITVSSSENEARQILESIKNGTTTFEDAAKASSQDWAADRGGDMGAAMAHELTWLIENEQAREAVVTLAKSEISDIYKVSSGWVFYRVDEAAYPADFNDSTHRQNIQNYIMQNLRGQVEDWAISEAEKFSVQAREQSFAAAVIAGRIPIKSFGPIPLNYGNSDLFAAINTAGIPELQNAGNDEYFWRAAFTTPLNSISTPFVIGDNAFVLFPKEETALEADYSGFIRVGYASWLAQKNMAAPRAYFLNSEKMDNRFQDTFMKLWSPN